jgi:hypothetical protein
MSVISNIYAVLITQRILIVIAATLLVLAVARKMLPPLLAWGVAAWWAVLPINYDTLYSVHLFAVLPLLLACVAATRLREPWNRAVSLGILVLTMVLVRNEVMIATGCWGLVCLIWEIRRRRRWKSAQASFGPEFVTWRVVMTYVLCIACSGVVIGYFYSRNRIKRSEMNAVLESKHTVNMGQVYAFGHQQRHPEWTASPWTDYSSLMQATFGRPAPTLVQMIKANPKAVIEHFWWNVKLVPSGVQVMLFNATSSDLNPDYIPIRTEPVRPKYLGLACVGVVVLGLLFMLICRRWWMANWFGPRAGGFLVLTCIAMNALLVIPTQRPRPSYLFAQSLFLMIVVATAVWIIGRTLFGLVTGEAGKAGSQCGPCDSAARPSRNGSRLRWIGTIVATPAVFALVWVKSINGYAPGIGPTGKPLPAPPRPVYELYDRLLPFQDVLRRNDTNWLIADFGFEMHHFVQFGNAGAVESLALLDKMQPDETLAAYLDRARINAIYLDTSGMARLAEKDPGLLTDFFRTASQNGWRILGSGDMPAVPRQFFPGRWMMLYKPTPKMRDKFPAGGEFVSLNPTFRGDFAGWRAISGLGGPEGPYPQFGNRVVRWGYGPVTKLQLKSVVGPSGGPAELVLDGLSGEPGQTVTIKLDGQTIAEIPWGDKGVFHEMTTPFTLPPGSHELELSYTVWQAPTPEIKLAVLFRRLEVRGASK